MVSWQSNRNELSLSKKVCPWHNPRSFVLFCIKWKWLQEFLRLLQCFLSQLPPPFSGVSTLIYTTSLPSTLPYTWTVDGLYWYLSHQPSLEVFWGGCKAAIILFRGHFLINAAREWATEHLMWWWSEEIFHLGLRLPMLSAKALNLIVWFGPMNPP